MTDSAHRRYGMCRVLFLHVDKKDSNAAHRDVPVRMVNLNAVNCAFRYSHEKLIPISLQEIVRHFDLATPHPTSTAASDEAEHPKKSYASFF
ncbi:hypothetical protein [Pigmentiphaga litoralis]|uniref:hypothetical protein n=1 Tax=Pigmentiphaga litoralis TaxID=516702 RepID=UPI003B430A45